VPPSPGGVGSPPSCPRHAPRRGARRPTAVTPGDSAPLRPALGVRQLSADGRPSPFQPAIRVRFPSPAPLPARLRHLRFLYAGRRVRWAVIIVRVRLRTRYVPVRVAAGLLDHAGHGIADHPLPVSSCDPRAHPLSRPLVGQVEVRFAEVGAEHPELAAPVQLWVWMRWPWGPRMVMTSTALGAR